MRVRIIIYEFEVTSSSFSDVVCSFWLPLALPFDTMEPPPHLIPLTLEVAQLALNLNEYDVTFFHHLAQIFPYDTLTIRVCFELFSNTISSPNDHP